MTHFPSDPSRNWLSLCGALAVTSIAAFGATAKPLSIYPAEKGVLLDTGEEKSSLSTPGQQVILAGSRVVAGEEATGFTVTAGPEPLTLNFARGANIEVTVP